MGYSMGMNDRIAECRRQAKEAGISWADVAALKSQMRADDDAAREPLEGARRYAWELYLRWNGRSLTRLPFWRCGFEIVRAWLHNSGRDFTAIARYDEIFTAVACEYPEWAERSADDLWEFLFEAYVPRRSPADFYELALDTIIEHANQPRVAAESYGDF